MTEYEKFINSDEYQRWRMADEMHFYPEHLTTYTNKGTPEENLEFFYKIEKEYPNRKFSTCIVSRMKLKDGLEFCLVRRFVSEEFSTMYCTWPPYYIRNGGKVL